MTSYRILFIKAIDIKHVKTAGMFRDNYIFALSIHYKKNTCMSIMTYGVTKYIVTMSIMTYNVTKGMRIASITMCIEIRYPDEERVATCDESRCRL